jgi:putative MATE family efflux protein
MRALWLANILNIVLDPLLIFGPGPFPALGLEGAAIATTLSRGIGVAYQLRRLSAPGGRLRLTRSETRFDGAIMARLVRVSAIGVVQFLISTTSFVWLFRMLAQFGATTLAGYTIAIRIIVFILLPAWGMGNAAATLVGQNLGAGNPDRAERSVWITARANTFFLGLVAVAFLLFAEPLVSIFAAEADVIAVAARCLRTVSYSYVVWGFGMVTVLAFNGSGDTTTPTWLNLAAYWVVQLPLAWALSGPLELGPQGVFVAIAVGQLALAVLGVTAFRRGAWKHREI